jgi:hypothetical protein
MLPVFKSLSRCAHQNNAAVIPPKPTEQSLPLPPQLMRSQGMVEVARALNLLAVRQEPSLVLCQSAASAMPPKAVIVDPSVQSWGWRALGWGLVAALWLLSKALEVRIQGWQTAVVGTHDDLWMHDTYHSDSTTRTCCLTLGRERHVASL